MPKNRKYQRYIVNGDCHDGCKLSIAHLGKGEAALVLRDIEEGWSNVDVASRHEARDPDTKFSHAAVGRHRNNHLTNVEEAHTNEALGELTELEALDMAIKQGQKNMHNWKMTPSEWMKAMELKLRLTEGTVYDGMNAAIAAASQEDDEGSAQPAVRPERVAEAGEPTQSVRTALPEGRPASGAGDVAGEQQRAHQHAGSGEPVGQDLRHRDEAHPQVRVQEGATPDGTAPVAE